LNKQKPPNQQKKEGKDDKQDENEEQLTVKGDEKLG